MKHTQVAANRNIIRNAVCSPACLGGAVMNDAKRAEALKVREQRRGEWGMCSCGWFRRGSICFVSFLSLSLSLPLSLFNL